MEKVSIIEEALRKLAEVRKAGRDEFLDDWKLQDIALRNFQVAIEGCIDIANRIISMKMLRVPKSSTDSIEVLADSGILPKKFAETMKQIARFRNVIVHLYGDIDLRIVYENLGKLDDFREFIRHVLGALEKKSK